MMKRKSIEKEFTKVNSFLIAAEGFGKLVSRMESAERALPTRGKLKCTGKINPAALGGFAKQSADNVSRFTAGTHQFILLFEQVENLFST